jgi:hypothetical protein
LLLALGLRLAAVFIITLANYHISTLILRAVPD